AEDGIRDFHVTGVQTCALPICPPPRWRSGRCRGRSRRCPGGRRAVRAPHVAPSAVVSWRRPAAEKVSATRTPPAGWSTTLVELRSEERRVGKGASTLTTA